MCIDLFSSAVCFDFIILCRFFIHLLSQETPKKNQTSDYWYRYNTQKQASSAYNTRLRMKVQKTQFKMKEFLTNLEFYQPLVPYSSNCESNIELA